MSVLVRALKAGETTLALLIAQLLVFVVPFRLTARLFRTRKPANAPAGDAAAASGQLIGQVMAQRIARVARRLPWTSTCLVRAIAGSLLLSRRGVASHIRFGVLTENGRLAGHAWLMVGDATVLGAGPETDRYVPLADLVSS